MDGGLESLFVPVISSVTIGITHRWTCVSKLKLLLYGSFCLTTLSSVTSANTENCKTSASHRGVLMQVGLESRFVERVEKADSIRACRDACCQKCHCNVAWLLEGKCYLLDCSLQGKCQLKQTGRSDSILIFIHKLPPCGDSQSPVLRILEEHFHYKAEPRTFDLDTIDRTLVKGQLSGKPLIAKQNKIFSRTRREASQPSGSSAKLPQIGKESTSEQSATTPPINVNKKLNWSKNTQHLHEDLQTSGKSPKENETENDQMTKHSASKSDGRDSIEVQTVPPKVPGGTSMPNAAPLISPLPNSNLSSLSTQQKWMQLNTTNDSMVESVPVSSIPTLLPSTPLAQVKTTATAQSITPASISNITTATRGVPEKPAMKELVVSAGDSVEVTLPKNEVELNAYVLPETSKGSSYKYEWQLLTHHPQDYRGEMAGQHSKTLTLSRLSVGVYMFKVIVQGDNAYGEGSVNVTVKPAPRVNQFPVAIVSPKFQEISLPTTSTFIDGSQSTDDDKIVSYQWEEEKGPLREEKVSASTQILKLTNLVPGNYTFSLTVVDSDGASNSTTAAVTVHKAVDYPPVANAGANQVLTLPKNSIMLYGNQSTDDHGIVSYEWSLSPKSKGKVVEMQGVRTSSLQLSAMQEGDYIFQLTVTDAAGHQATAEVMVIVQPENNKAPVADSGPDKELTLPVDSTILDGSKSTDDQKIISYQWEKTSGPIGMKIENADSAIATVTGLQVGSYEITLTVKDERNLESHHSVRIIVREEVNKAPVAKIARNVVITLPSNTAMLDGSKSSDDKGIVNYLWMRDESSPAAGDVLNNSDHQPVLFLSNLVEGLYTFCLKVTDAKGENHIDRATLEVRPDPRKNDLVEIVLDVSVSQLTERQKGMLLRQIAVLLGVLDSDITVLKIQPYTEQSTQIIFCVRNTQAQQVLKGQDVARILKNKFRKQKSDFLVFRALQVGTVICQLNCSDHGRCDSFNKRCLCDPFWMENFIRVQLGDGERNCEWSVLYVVIAAFIILVTIGILVWMVLCFCKRRKGKPRRKSRYKILDATDDHESLELKSSSKPVGRLKAPAQNTSLMVSESELDSDEAIFTWPDREKGKLLRNQNGSIHNGQVVQKIKKQREEIL
ncbi:dyslexia-associated protein KIAA0319-like protein isoform X1 [Scyliorhinus canicula]|uniref:dyslexia-associated protein KIAA0319-like protein isoform X1 n=2 Tax=Scyliorhinus canicula TaxID=7830 RepID=UPI0018F49930|nr:dyslexia-associated protein KIAA0319-like protein isoform X1 [Scyliorhinus canicula]XP_038655896.1 dyslexia-associated protein KIAA0319-like protein isoform X1 [Scyliorhinus canicula]XP_038655905.1 dyslexia-associated protein KIAA0319-like protein isoform X1 [Scyliorhinus canicula]